MNTLEEKTLGLEVSHGISKRILIPAGVLLEQHSHKFPHKSLLISGEVVVQIEGQKKKVYAAPAEITVAANLVHSVVALTDVIWYCIHELEHIKSEDFDSLLVFSDNDPHIPRR